MRFRLSAIAEATGGEVVGDDVEIDGVTIDSRQVSPGQLFVPIVAERDGHDFVDGALDRGAAAYLSAVAVERPPAVSVADTALALSALGVAARARISGSVIGITGSVGKTSAKDLLASVLSTRLRTAASVRSFNNELGVPLTLVNAPDDVEAAIIEMGARGIGHIAELCAVASPTVGVVTRIAAVHTSEFGSIDDVAVAKGELVESLGVDGLAVLNADDERVAALASRTDAAVLTYGLAGEISAVDVSLGTDLHPSFVLATPAGRADVRLGVAGEHQVSNALAAAAVATHLGLGVDEIVAGLADASLSPWRMEVGTTSSGATVINDAYNANPTSMRAGFDALASLVAPRKVAVIGLMAELGSTSDEDHLVIGREAADRGFEVIAVGADYGVGTRVDDAAAAVALLGDLDADTAVLVKGSRVAELESVAAALLA